MRNIDDLTGDEGLSIPDLLPVLPLKETVVFPYTILPLSIGEERNALAVDRALADGRFVLLVSQREGNAEEPGIDDLHEIGTVAVIMRMLKLPDGRLRILVQGLSRARVEHMSQVEPFLQAQIHPLDETVVEERSLEAEALFRSVRDGVEKVASLGRQLSPEVLMISGQVDDAGRLADLVASNLELSAVTAQEILETLDPGERLRRVNDLLAREIQLLTVQQELSIHARDEMDRSQREYFLRQQLRAIQEELGEGDDLAAEIAGYRRQADERGLSDDAREELQRQVRRLERSHPDSAETALIRGHLEWLTGLPWERTSEDRLDLESARTILDEDHYDLEPVKERILEVLAVRKLNPASRGPILCFVGPPGVGKTSLGRSIARALDREFARISLGGVRDEAEIRGHRRTYVGALPGRILQGIHHAGTSNPVFMLDEIDKLGADFRGDPSSALLEVLDPEQNSAFRDHYLGVDYDLSRVLFIATANLTDPIQPAFLDRLEVLRLSGYTTEEKLAIAGRHLLPKQIREHGLDKGRLTISPEALRRVVVDYTREAGLRNLERELARICRKAAVQIAGGRRRRIEVGERQLEKLLGPPRFAADDLLERDRVGVATGLAWTAAGGDLLFIEAMAVPGKGELLLTGRLGEVMRESAQAALSFTRGYCDRNGLPTDFFARHDLHIHAPAGSIPKDGPSAGITIATALASVVTGRAVRRKVAMTGEITLRGDVLAVGGLKEKVLAARQAGLREIVLPSLNRRDIGEIPPELRKGLRMRWVESVDEVLEIALLRRRAGRGSGLTDREATARGRGKRP